MEKCSANVYQVLQPVNPQNSSAHLLVPEDNDEWDSNKVGRASHVLEDQQFEDGPGGVVPLSKEDSSEVAASSKESKKIDKSKVGTSIASHPEERVRVEPGGDQLQHVPGGHGQGTKSKRHNHDNHGEDQVGEVRRGVEDLAQGDVQVPGHDHHLARVGLRLDEIIPSCGGR